MAAKSSLDQVLDKKLTFALAERIGVPVPRSQLVATPDDLPRLSDWCSFPVVVKPGSSMGESSELGRAQLKVEYAFDAGQLQKLVRNALNYGEVILQEYVAGVGAGIEVLASEGRVLFHFQHQRLHEVPLTGGGSSLRKSVAVTPQLLEATGKLIEALNWTGVAMVEFKQDLASGQFSLMEVNGRFWGSLPLAEAAGADFPGMLYELLVGQQTEFPQSYQTEVHCRRLTADVHWYELALRKAAPPQLGVVPSRKTMWRDFLGMFSPRHRFDVQKLADPLPGLLELLWLGRDYCERLYGVLRRRQALRREKQRCAAGGSLEGALSGAENLLFLCYGNINRSAVAGLLAKQLMPNLAEHVRSAGFHPASGRPMDGVMQQVAHSNGLATDNFASSALSATEVAAADVIFVMELEHLVTLSEQFPWVSSKAFLLGGLAAGSGPLEIADPYGKSRDDYEGCYRQVAANIAALQARMEAA
ncbi:ATP-grasp domain-containing protein [Pseudomaricurvus sp. HS19]|uniref:arsenate reductase/protein-tyrosine-phosphatase family protein n=1 Tax=Pseudomaricurvus sp. HS19 TaxID=2692626 RepID=UPI00136E0DB1|nr:ATP-grasp domain-containing protein [Pseudomaricurvus sp. HS19]MYM62043.1 hypothetical protein [Pseudomaricurvus sp. HS19]